MTHGFAVRIHDMDFAYDAEQELVIATVRKFAERDLRSWAVEADTNATLPSKLISAATDMGFFVDAVPASAGGMLDSPYSHLTRVLRSYELGRGCAALSALLECNVEPALAVGQWGTLHAQRELFESLAGGGFATTARDSRGDLEIVSDGKGLRINGHIGPVPGLALSSHVLLLAAADKQPVVLLIATSSCNIDVVATSGWRAAKWATMRCQQAVVDEEHIVAIGPHAAAITDCILAWHRCSLAARAAGVAAAAMEHAERYGRERVQFGQAIGNFESLIRLREDSQTAAAMGKLAAQFAGWSCDQLGAQLATSAMPNAKLASAAWDAASRARIVACDAVSKSTIDAVQIFGGYGFVADYPVEKLMRDARAFEALLGDERLERTLRARNAA
jgi:alkylation response protein AidB-like acyl-CoA dehydrogenase